MARPDLTTYRDRLFADLDTLEAMLHSLPDISTIKYVNPNRRNSGIWYVGASDWGWAPTDDSQHAARMELDGLLAFWEERYSILAAKATREVAKRADEALGHLRDWIKRTDKYDHSIPRTIDEASKPGRAGSTTFGGPSGS